LIAGKETLGHRFPKKVVFFGVEIGDTEFRIGLSPSLKRSLPKAVALLQEELNGWE
jgi:Ni,Fe-hydrogenase maturation factor